MSATPHEITQILDLLRRGESTADRLLNAVYAELRRLAAAKMAREAPGHTLQATALVHEAWLRLGGSQQHWQNRAHFFSAAAEAMRRILIESARRKKAERHGGGQQRVDIDMMNIVTETKEDEFVAVNEALDKLAAYDAQKAELVKLRYFVGLTLEQAAEILGLPERTAKRHWASARAWLYDVLNDQESSGRGR